MVGKLAVWGTIFVVIGYYFNLTWIYILSGLSINILLLLFIVKSHKSNFGPCIIFILISTIIQSLYFNHTYWYELYIWNAVSFFLLVPLITMLSALIYGFTIRFFKK